MRTIRLLSVLLALILLVPAACADQGPASHLGETLPDFEVTTLSGEVFRLSDALKENDAVFINLWATWCPPCRAEFPYLEEAWRQYQDRISVIALSVEPEDTDEILASFAAENGLTFAIGSDISIGLSDLLGVTGIPTSLIVDRYGVIAWIDSGAQPDTDSFIRLFEAFIGDGYTETVLWDHLPPRLPAAAPADESELNAILGSDVSGITLHNDPDSTVWPMLPLQANSRDVLVSTNAHAGDSTAAVLAAVTAGSGDALAFDFRTSTEAAMDFLTIAIDGNPVKHFAGEHEWTSWALPLTEGEHEIRFSYEKDASYDEGEDTVWLANIRLLSGEEASNTLAALPVYPVAEEFAVHVLNTSARRITFTGEGAALLPEYYGNTENWILADDALNAEITLSEDLDPEMAFAYSYYDGIFVSLAQALSADGTAYNVTFQANTEDTTGLPLNLVMVYPSRFIQSEDEIITLLFFADEQNTDAFVQVIADSTGLSLGWEYAETDEPSTASEAEYTLLFVDALNSPVAGVTVTVCDETTCIPMTSDENGSISFTAAPYPYEIHILKLPEGYAYEEGENNKAPESGGSMTFVLSGK